MLRNAYFLAKIGADRAENEQPFAEILPKTLRVRRADEPLSPDLVRGYSAAAFEAPAGCAAAPGFLA